MWKYWLLAIILAPVIYNVDVITGTYKFNKLCETEGGARYYGKIKRNVGWQVAPDHRFDYQWPFELSDVSFVRYQDESGEWKDVYRMPANDNSGQQFRFESVDNKKPPVYEFRFERVELSDKRMGRDRYMVIDIASNEILATFTSFGFSWTTPDRVLLSAPTGRICPENNDGYIDFVHDLFN